jgi:hypothetical protein
MSSCIALVGILIILGILFFARKAKAQDGLDRQVILQLQQAGSDISKPHQIDFFFYFPTLESADRIAAKLSSDGYSAKAEKAAIGSLFVVEATKSIIPEEATLANLRQVFNEMSDAENGEYDGWGAEVVK